MEREATKRQLWALFCITKKDHRGLGLTFDEASKMIAEAKSAAPPFKELYDNAHAAGMKAAAGIVPTPMVVQQHSNMLDDSSPVEKEWVVEGGVCGFAWINIKPATSSFVKWLKKQGIGRIDGYYGGWTIWVDNFGQSMTRKEAYAQAFAGVLKASGIKAYAMSRLD